MPSWGKLGAVLALTVAGVALHAGALEAGPLSQEDRAWLERHPVLRVGLEANYPPFSFVGLDGRPAGISVDYLRLLEDRLGVRFEVAATGDLSALLELVRRGELDVLTSLTETPERSAYLAFTTPYFASPAVLVVRRGHAGAESLEGMAGARVAVGRGYGVVQFLRARAPRVALEEVANDDAALRLLLAGGADAAVLDLASLSWILSSTGMQGLRVLGDVGFSYDLALATRREEPVLRRLLESGLQQVPRAEAQRVRDAWVVLEVPGRRDRGLWLGLVGALLAAVAVALVIYALNRALRREVARRTEDLGESERRYRALFETMPVGVVYQDADGRIVSANPAAQRILGLSLDQLQGRTSVDPGWRTLHEDGSDFPGTEHPAVVALRTGREVHNVIMGVYAPARGRHAWLDVSAVPLPPSAGAGGGVHAIFEDVTARRQAELERTSLQAQLAQSQKLESIGRLAGGVAHDFNNLLTIVLGCGEELRQGLLEGKPPSGEAVDDIVEAARRASELTRQLLAFARRQVIAPVSLDLNEVIRAQQKLLDRIIGEDVRVEVRLAEGLAPVRCDPGLLGQVIVNLAVNARDAMPGGGTFSLATANLTVAPGEPVPEPEMAPGEYVRLSASDTGSGMTGEVLAHVFEPFFTTKAPGSGTGLGLATVYGIVKQSDGFIGVRSAPGEGTTFELYFPRCEALEVQPEAPPAESEGGSETVLVVEDDAGVRSVATRALVTGGYQVLAAASLEEALALLRTRPWDVELLLTDVVMPGSGGPEVAKRVAELRPDIRVLYMSGYTRDAINRHGVLDEGVEFIGKPFTASELRTRVRQSLDRPPRTAP